MDTRDFDTVLSELEARRLLISGAGETGLDALYDLMGPAFLTPFQMTLGERISGFLHLTLRGVPLRTARGLFREPKRTGLQRDVWRLIKQRPLSTAEIIRCIELGVTDVSRNSQLVESICSEEGKVDYKNIGVYSRLSDQQQPVLAVVTQLYLNKQVILDICN